MHQSLALFISQLAVKNEAVIETPWGSYSRKLPWWGVCASRGRELRVDLCRFGSLARRTTCMLVTSSALGSLARRCNCATPHTRVAHSRTNGSASYPETFCEELARIARGIAKVANASSKHASHAVDVEGGDVRDHRGSQRFVSHLWSTQLAEALPWRTRRAYRFKHPNHINVLEEHAHKTLIQLAPMGSRLVVFQDSMVTLGANAKGRSSSLALNRLLRKSLALQLAKNVYAVGIHSPTWAIRADDPSRQKRLRAPRVPLPSWLLQLKAGDLAGAQDVLDLSSGTPRSWSRWLLFIQIARLAVNGDYVSFSEWSAAHAATQRPRRSGSGTGHRCYSEPSRTADGTVSGLDTVGRTRLTTTAGAGTVGSDSSGDPTRRIRTSPVRAGCPTAPVCGDHQRHSPALPVCANILGGPVAPAHHLGSTVARESTSPCATTAASSPCDHGTGVGLGAVCHGSSHGILRIIATLRSHCTEGQRLLVDLRDRRAGRDLSQNAVGQEQDARSTHANSKTGRAVRSLLSQEMFQNHATRRKDLVFLLSSTQKAAPADAGGCD